MNPFDWEEMSSALRFVLLLALVLLVAVEVAQAATCQDEALNCDTFVQGNYCQNRVYVAILRKQCAKVSTIRRWKSSLTCFQSCGAC